MAHRRRRSRSGFPLAVLAAVLTAVFAARSAYTKQLAQAERTRNSSPVSAPAAAPATTARAASPADDRTQDNRTSRGFTSRQRLVEHFEKHGAEFPGLDMAGYLKAAQTLRDSPTGGDILEIRRGDGVISRFDRRNGSFLAVNRDGTIRTFFRPNDGESYFRRQAQRSPGGGP